ncbi:hypothetical protein Dsin_000479 [Dipteronia sinensis]|uniref:RING-type domain-containing protein n=1 Tax=Dipteronia sinensis TaxID=43782 RepID=A0AAE0B245_9ROSI|nr:hypothetical protein Dsin_000479 [Dipteronia sinensis]
MAGGSRNRTKSKGKRKQNSKQTNNVQSHHNSKSDGLTDEEKLEKQLLTSLGGMYDEACSWVVSHGYEHDEALKAILTNGHAFGNSDVVTNIVHNSLFYLRTGMVFDNGTYRQGHQVFDDLPMLAKTSLSVIVNMICQARPDLTKLQVMWCLLRSKFEFISAGSVHLELDTNESGRGSSVKDSGGDCKREPLSFDKNESGKGSLLKDSCGDCERESKSMERFDFTPSLAYQLEMNVAEYAAAYRADMKVSQEPLPQTLDNPRPTTSDDGFELDEYSIPGDGPVDPKTATISCLIEEIKELKLEVMEQKEWANRKVIQATETLTSNLREIKLLRMERVKSQLAKDRKLEKEAKTMKLIMDMEDELRKTTCEADHVDAQTKVLETEHAQMSAEIQAFKLSASESDRLCLEAEKKERKILKKITALEKHNKKLREEIAEEENESLQSQQQLTYLKKAQEDIEVRWRQELQAKDLNITQMQYELRLKEGDEIQFKRKQEAICKKMEVECQLYEDDVQRVEQDLSLEAVGHLPADLISELEPERSQTYSRLCLICMEKEASVVFLPCAHQALCARCNQNQCRNVGYRCSCCQTLISQTIKAIYIDDV